MPSALLVFPFPRETMKHQDIILPNASLFLVHKGWSSRQQRPQRAPAEAASRGETATLDVKTFSHPWAQQISANSGEGEEERGKVSSEQRPGRFNAAKRFEFVNTTRPDRPSDPKVRKLVMSHVKTGVKRGPNMQRTPKPKSTAHYSEPHLDATTEKGSYHLKNGVQMLHPPVSGASSPLYGNTPFPLLTGPRSQLLLSYYLYELATSWYPLEAHLAYNPVWEGWFRLAITDELLFRSILFSSASHLGRKSGNQNYEEVAALALPIFHHLNQRLQANSMPSDTTISIVSCLAMVELSVGNFDNWKLHMAAIKEMVLLRGGLGNVGAALQIKITRADIEGSSDTITIPNLLPPPRSSPPIYSNIPDPSSSPFQGNVDDRTHYKGLSSEVQSILLNLSRLTHTLRHAISCGDTPVDPRSLDEDIIHIHHEILKLLATVSTSDRLSSSINTSTLIKDLNEATAIAALLYAKSLSRGTGSIPTHERPIIRRLVSLLNRIHKYLIAKDSEKSYFQSPYSDVSTLVPPRLLLWLHYMGGIAARGSEAEFFTDSLMRFLAIGSPHNGGSEVVSRPWPILPSWQDIKQMLSEVLWFPLFHDGLGERLWELAVKRSKVHC